MVNFKLLTRSTSKELDFDQDLDVDPSDPQGESKHGWQHDEKQDHKHPCLEDTNSETPQVLRHHYQLSRPSCGHLIICTQGNTIRVATKDVQKHIPCHQLNNFYNGVGDVNVEVIKKILADNKQESVIGWYRQRRNTDQQMTFREKLVHEKLKISLSNPHMIFLLLTPSSITPPGSTHRMEYAALISRSRRFTNVPVLVNNLGLLGQLSYWKVSAPCSAAGYSLTMKKHSPKFFCSNGLLKEVSEVNKMNDSLQSELQVREEIGALRPCLNVLISICPCVCQKACLDVEESERLVEALQADILALRKKLGEKKQDATGEAAGDGPPEEKNNLLLQEAVRSLFASLPQFHTQTLTLEGFPVCCGTEHDASTAEHHGLCSLVNPSCDSPLKRLKELPMRESKRRKSSW
ncbi:unnamed protein product [Tetraodon nigroviridis]|uniref:(spotted green pufferfish) hypothetical protein n=1 Tax=Tetraodon nigroviridis TaxID=99883 RepID=Q4SYF3_TETNG|nr:unnamed protein product [Tetraodon nigroviridis]